MGESESFPKIYMEGLLIDQADWKWQLEKEHE
jgi:hypothetical protein